MCDRLVTPIYPISTLNEIIPSLPLVISHNNIEIQSNARTKYDFSRIVFDSQPDHCLTKDNKFTEKAKIIVQHLIAGPFHTNNLDLPSKQTDTYFHFKDLGIPITLELDYDPKKQPEDMNLIMKLDNNPIEMKNNFATQGPSSTDKILVDLNDLNDFFRSSKSPFFQNVISSLMNDSQLEKQIKIDIASRISDTIANNGNPNHNYMDKMNRMKEMLDVIVK